MRPLPCQVWVESQHECHEHGSGILPEVVLAREETAVWAEMDLGRVNCGHCKPPAAEAWSCAMLLGDEAQQGLCLRYQGWTRSSSGYKMWQRSAAYGRNNEGLRSWQWLYRLEYASTHLCSLQWSNSLSMCPHLRQWSHNLSMHAHLASTGIAIVATVI